MSLASIPRAVAKQTGIDTIYLSGPMTGIAEFNYPAFHAAAVVLRASGYDVYSPAEGAAGGVTDTTGLTGTEHPDAIGFDLRAAFADYARHITTDADAVAVLPGWEDSRGARGEVALAVAIGLPVLDALTGETITATFSVNTDRNTDRAADRAAEVTALPSTGVDRDALAACMDRHPAGKRRTPQTFTPATPRERSEIRVTSATGAQKGQKEAAMHLVPAGPLWELAVLYGRGQAKYPDAVDGAPNWKRGYSWSSSYSALIRHANLFWMGEDHDPEMAVKHVIAVAWHALNLAWFMENRPEFDDRPTSVAGERYDGALPTPQWLLDLQQARAGAGTGTGQQAAE